MELWTGMGTPVCTTGTGKTVFIVSIEGSLIIAGSTFWDTLVTVWRVTVSMVDVSSAVATLTLLATFTIMLTTSTAELVACVVCCMAVWVLYGGCGSMAVWVLYAWIGGYEELVYEKLGSNWVVDVVSSTAFTKLLEIRSLIRSRLAKRLGLLKLFSLLSCLRRAISGLLVVVLGPGEKSYKTIHQPRNLRLYLELRSSFEIYQDNPWHMKLTRLNF